MGNAALVVLLLEDLEDLQKGGGESKRVSREDFIRILRLCLDAKLCTPYELGWASFELVRLRRPSFKQ